MLSVFNVFQNKYQKNPRTNIQKTYKYLKDIFKNKKKQKVKLKKTTVLGTPETLDQDFCQNLGLGNSGSLIVYFKIFENFVKHFFGYFKLDRIRMTKLA